MNDYKARLVKEEKELSDRYYKLQAFIDGTHFESLGKRSKELLILQYNAMGQYMYILKLRIEAEEE